MSRLPFAFPHGLGILTEARLLEPLNPMRCCCMMIPLTMCPAIFRTRQDWLSPRLRRRHVLQDLSMTLQHGETGFFAVNTIM